VRELICISFNSTDFGLAGLNETDLGQCKGLFWGTFSGKAAANCQITCQRSLMHYTAITANSQTLKSFFGDFVQVGMKT
jgi:hypothetical protein